MTHSRFCELFVAGLIKASADPSLVMLTRNGSKSEDGPGSWF